MANLTKIFSSVNVGFASDFEQSMAAKSASGLPGRINCTLPTPRRNLLCLAVSTSSVSVLFLLSTPGVVMFLPPSAVHSIPSSLRSLPFGTSLNPVVALQTCHHCLSGLDFLEVPLRDFQTALKTKRRRWERPGIREVRVGEKGKHSAKNKEEMLGHQRGQKGNNGETEGRTEDLLRCTCMRGRERARRVAHSFLRRWWKARGAESVPAGAACSPKVKTTQGGSG